MLQIFERQYFATNCFLNLVFLVVYFLFCTNILLLKSFTTMVYVLFAHVWPNVYTKEDFEKIDLFRNVFSNIVFLEKPNVFGFVLKQRVLRTKKIKRGRIFKQKARIEVFTSKIIYKFVCTLTDSFKRLFSKKQKLNM